MTCLLKVYLGKHMMYITLWLNEDQYDVQVSTMSTRNSRYKGPDKALALATVCREMAFYV